MPITPEEVSAAILAGGNNRRMGTDKGLLQFGTQPIIAHILAVVQQVDITRTAIIANNSAAYVQFGVTVLPDIFPYRSSLNGVYSALHHSATDWVLVLACDMPLIQPGVLRLLYTVPDGYYDAVVPCWHGEAQPFVALYNRRIADRIRCELDAGRLALGRMLNQICVHWIETQALGMVDPEGQSFVNLNTPDEWRQAQAGCFAEKRNTQGSPSQQA